MPSHLDGSQTGDAAYGTDLLISAQGRQMGCICPEALVRVFGLRVHDGMKPSSPLKSLEKSLIVYSNKE
jgi:hypothetical protein